MKNAAPALLLGILVVSCAPRQQPAVTPPVTPSESDQDLRELPQSPQWKPGDPVREMPDLRESPDVHAFESLWSPSSPCRTGASPLSVLEDAAAKRRLLSRWAPGNHFCIAISRTADPVTGGWYLYEFSLPLDGAGSALEIAENAYVLRIDLGGARAVFAFDRMRMLEGAPAAYTRMPPGATGPP